MACLVSGHGAQGAFSRRFPEFRVHVSAENGQVDALRAGLNEILPVQCLAAFRPAELRQMFCGEDRVEWDERALQPLEDPVEQLFSRSFHPLLSVFNLISC